MARPEKASETMTVKASTELSTEPRKYATPSDTSRSTISHAKKTRNAKSMNL